MPWYTVKHVTEEGQCEWCGYPIYCGEKAYDYCGGMYCSAICAKDDLADKDARLDRRLAELKGGQS